MIIVELSGGLGNQMFQFACAKALSLKHRQPLLVDLRFLSQNTVPTAEFTPRAYELGIFNLDCGIAGQRLAATFDKMTLFQKVAGFLGYAGNQIIIEVPDGGLCQLDHLTFPVMLKGYWQSAQYFSGYEKEIRATFAFGGQLPPDLLGLAAGIKRRNAVSMHFRRGDYITNPVARAVLGPLGMDYYRSAVEMVRKKIADPYFYIFSDDPEWAARHVPVGENYQVVKNSSGSEAWHDMFLMSCCKHHIIANSSYSWWGAWLNANPKKTVIAPERWFAREELNTNAGQLIPSSWIVI